MIQTVALRASPSSLDIERFSEVFNGSLPNSEDFKADVYLEKDISKPWGHEHRVYADSFYDVWHLEINSGQKTSMHCHPRKETALLCLDGQAKIHLLHETYLVSSGQLIYLKKGAFHCTENVGNSSLHLVEVETPRNKFDLVRLEDSYGRVGKHYEEEILEEKLPELEKGEILRSTIKQFSFGLKTGSTLMKNSNIPFLFLISLSLERAFSQEIDVLVPSEFDPSSLSPTADYLIISKFPLV